MAQVSITLSPAAIAIIQEMANNEKRSFSRMSEILLDESIKSRDKKKSKIK